MKIWQLLLAAFCGGMCLSLSELMGMIAKKEMVDMFFLMGMVLAGVIGIGGFFAVGASSIRTAFVAGVSAPQILGGIAKAAPTAAKALSMLLAGSIAYAQPPQVVDSAKVTVVIEGYSDSLQVKCGDKVYTVGDSSKVVLPARATAIVSGFMIQPSSFVLDTGAQTLKLSVRSMSSKANFMRGLFAQQQSSAPEMKVFVDISK